jgi:hypothetical protein
MWIFPIESHFYLELIIVNMEKIFGSAYCLDIFSLH